MQGQTNSVKIMLKAEKPDLTILDATGINANHFKCFTKSTVISFTICSKSTGIPFFVIMPSWCFVPEIGVGLKKFV